MAGVQYRRRLRSRIIVSFALFGFALSATVSHLRLGVMDDSRTAESRELIARLSESKSFQLARYYFSVNQMGDAISRGADLRGHNLLGMTPIELSIDLGRNDISFMLLSMRGGEDGQPRQAPTADSTAKPAPKQARTPPGAARGVQPRQSIRQAWPWERQLWEMSRFQTGSRTV